MRDTIEEALDAVDVAVRLPDVGERRKRVEAAIELLKANGAATPTREYRYALAYAIYFHPDRVASEELADRVEKLLLSVLEEQPDDCLSHLYLGHNRYDRRDMAGAQAAFLAARECETDSYTRTKVFEMLACCAVAINGIGGALAEVAAYASYTESVDSADVWPSVLAKSIFDALRMERLEPKCLSSLQSELERIDRAGKLGDWMVGIIKRSQESSEQMN